MAEVEAEAGEETAQTMLIVSIQYTPCKHTCPQLDMHAFDPRQDSLKQPSGHNVLLSTCQSCYRMQYLLVRLPCVVSTFTVLLTAQVGRCCDCVYLVMTRLQACTMC